MPNGWSADDATGKKTRAGKKDDDASAGCKGHEYHAGCENSNDYDGYQPADAVGSHGCHPGFISNGSYALEFRLQCHVYYSGLRCHVNVSRLRCHVVGPGFECNVICPDFQCHVVGSRLKRNVVDASFHGHTHQRR